MGLGSLFKRNKNKKVEETADCHIEINTQDCDGCEKCVIACQNNVLMMADDVSSVWNAQACKSCKVCMAICPNDCISVN